MKKSVVHIVLNTFEYDSRVMRECQTLSDIGYNVTVIAFWRQGLRIKFQEENINIVRVKLISIDWSNHPIVQIFKYCEFMIKSLKVIHSIKPNICHCHDLGGLFVGFFAKFISKHNLIYDSHELWGFTTHMNSYNRILYKIGGLFQKISIKKADVVITVNDSIADIIKQNNKINNIKVLRNIPDTPKTNSLYARDYFELSECKFILLYIGSITQGRGINNLIYVMEKVNNNIGLALVGGGNKFTEELKILIEKLNLSGQIKFLKRVDPDDVIDVCRLADAGIHPIENTCLNHYYCLPNKIFQYIQAGLPILCSNLPEMKKIIDTHEVGKVFDINNINDTAAIINNFFNNKVQLTNYRNNSINASKQLTWSIEKKKLIDIYSHVYSMS